MSRELQILVEWEGLMYQQTQDHHVLKCLQAIMHWLMKYVVGTYHTSYVNGNHNDVECFMVERMCCSCYT